MADKFRPVPARQRLEDQDVFGYGGIGYGGVGVGEGGVAELLVVAGGAAAVL